MQCPIDQETLSITERQGIEIDYCPKCRGVWLDRGELDKLIEKASTTHNSQPVSANQPHYSQPEYHSDNGHYSDSKHYPKKKRESFLSDLFDFGD